jgi:hypothetical protein
MEFNNADFRKPAIDRNYWTGMDGVPIPENFPADVLQKFQLILGYSRVSTSRRAANSRKSDFSANLALIELSGFDIRDSCVPRRKHDFIIDRWSS